MEKYKTEFKLKVVKSFLAGEGGAKLLALVAHAVTAHKTVDNNSDWNLHVTDRYRMQCHQGTDERDGFEAHGFVCTGFNVT